MEKNFSTVRECTGVTSNVATMNARAAHEVEEHSGAEKVLAKEFNCSTLDGTAVCFFSFFRVNAGRKVYRLRLLFRCRCNRRFWMQLHDNVTGSSLSGSPFRRDAFVAEGVTSTVEKISLHAFFLSLRANGLWFRPRFSKGTSVSTFSLRFRSSNVFLRRKKRALRFFNFQLHVCLIR